MARTPKESPAQKRKVHKVMEEFKEGKLKSGKRGGGTTRKVTSRKQAIAIALSEAGASRPAKRGASKSTSGRVHAIRAAAAKKAAATRKANQKRKEGGTSRTTRHATHLAFTL